MALLRVFTCFIHMNHQVALTFRPAVSPPVRCCCPHYHSHLLRRLLLAESIMSGILLFVGLSVCLSHQVTMNTYVCVYVFAGRCA